MTDRSAFTDDEWSALSEAPLWVTLAVVTVGEHGPISMVKEAAASARAIAQPPDQGPADQLIAQLGKDAESKEARHDVKEHAGKTPDEIVEAAIRGVATAAAGMAKLTPDEAAEIRAWLENIGSAVAAAAKTVKPEEQAVLDRISAALGG
jgi:hypothetical protein